MIETVHFVDEVKGLGVRLKPFEQATSGVELLDTLVDVWGNYIPEIFGLAKALMNTRGTDKDTAAAWNGCMGGLRDACRKFVEVLELEGRLDSDWTSTEATEMTMTILSFQNWEQLVLECGWSVEQYVICMKRLLRQTFLQS